MKPVQPGSSIIELLLYIMFILPGMMYSAWRAQEKNAVCSNCGAKNPIPIQAAIAQKLVPAGTVEKGINTDIIIWTAAVLIIIALCITICYKANVMYY